MIDSERYRDKAAEMRVRALNAVTPDLAAMYRELAQHWEALAGPPRGRRVTLPAEHDRDKRQA